MRHSLIFLLPVLLAASRCGPGKDVMIDTSDDGTPGVDSGAVDSETDSDTGADCAWALPGVITILGSQAYDFVGYGPIAVGDFNGDCINDLAVSAPNTNGSGSDGSGQPGEVHLFWGPLTTDVTTVDSNAIITGGGADDGFGAVNIAMEDSDGADNLFASTFFSSTNNGGWFFEGPLVSTTAEGGATTSYTADIRACFKGLYAVGDLNGDGSQEVIASFCDKVAVVGMATTAGVVNASTDRLFEITDGSLGTVTVWRMAVGDYNGDGQDDLALIATDWQDSQNWKLYVHYGPIVGTVEMASADVIVADENVELLEFIYTIDHDGDGRDELVLVSMPLMPGQYMVDVLDVSIQGLFTSIGDLSHGSIDMTAARLHTMTVGDFNGDSRGDIALGNQFSSSGEVLVFEGPVLPGLNDQSADHTLAAPSGYEYRFGLALGTLPALGIGGADALAVSSGATYTYGSWHLYSNPTSQP